jgi:hypothetical protein
VSNTTEKLAEARAGKRPAKPGMVRIVVSIPETVHKALEAKAIEESAAFPRPVNEMLSILIERKWETLVADTMLYAPSAEDDE